MDYETMEYVDMLYQQLDYLETYERENTEEINRILNELRPYQDLM